MRLRWRPVDCNKFKFKYIKPSQVSVHSESLRIDNDSLLMENAQLRDRLSFLEGMAGVTTTEETKGAAPASPASGSVTPQPAVFTASNAALIELQELRR